MSNIILEHDNYFKEKGLTYLHFSTPDSFSSSGFGDLTVGEVKLDEYWRSQGRPALLVDILVTEIDNSEIRIVRDHAYKVDFVLVKEKNIEQYRVIAMPEGINFPVQWKNLLIFKDEKGVICIFKGSEIARADLRHTTTSK